MSVVTSRVDDVIAHMRALIEQGQFADGCLPSEPELARQLGASRATVRQALASLAEDGLILRRPGVGTFVNQRVLSIGTRLDEVWDFEEMIRLSGHHPGVRHLEIQLVPAGPILAEKLALSPEAEVLTTANVFLADRVPVIYCVDTIPAGLVTSAYRDEELHGPVYTFLRKRCGQSVDYNITKVLPVVADDRLSTFLTCSRGVAVHYFEETGFNHQGLPIIYSEEYYLPEYFSFTIVRKMTTSRGAKDA